MEHIGRISPYLAVFSTLFVGFVLVYWVTRKKDKEDQSGEKSKGLKREENASKGNFQEGKLLSAAEFKRFSVLKIVKTSHNTKLIRFEIPHGLGLGLPIGRHISVRAEVDGKKVMRPYTPTSRPDQKGYFDILVKCYDLGKMSPYLHDLKIGQQLEVRGPVGRFKYVKNSFKHIGLIAGGTGLTPCLQVIRCVLEQSEYKDDTTYFTLLFQNRTEDDILLKDELDSLVVKHRGRLNVIYFLSNPGDSLWGSLPTNTTGNSNGINTNIGDGLSSRSTNERKGYINKESLIEFFKPNSHRIDSNSTDNTENNNNADSNSDSNGNNGNDNNNYNSKVFSCQYVGLCGPGAFTDCMSKLLSLVGLEGEEHVHIF